MARVVVLLGVFVAIGIPLVAYLETLNQLLERAPREQGRAAQEPGAR